ncbi:hypothetical protein FN846DRAFT_902461 [Sphaerosporella brunnea]|uniref:Uncharacterized protein n=1 Tax=Sphaerosporella brunnea TaxID=1250544 RepID=A0A5J5FA37_9PEZI|nr:hypothetical protein FN846DRAFT_902461 [Sphaerosporella brunnea]
MPFDNKGRGPGIMVSEHLTTPAYLQLPPYYSEDDLPLHHDGDPDRECIGRSLCLGMDLEADEHDRIVRLWKDFIACDVWGSFVAAAENEDVAKMCGLSNLIKTLHGPGVPGSARSKSSGSVQAPADNGACATNLGTNQPRHLNLKQGLLKFVLPGERYIHRLDRDLVDTWEVGNSASSLGSHQHLGRQNLTRTVAYELQIMMDVVHDVFNDRVEADSWHSIPPRCVHQFRLPRIRYLTLAELREITIGFVGALRRLRDAPFISADLLRCMDLDHEYTGGDFLKDTIWVIAKQGRVAELEETENADCHVHKPATGGNNQELQRTYIAITQEWRPCHLNRLCPTTIKQILLPESTLIDEIQHMVTQGFEAIEENMDFTATSVEMLMYVDGQWVQIPDTQWRLEVLEGPVRVVLTYLEEW